MTPVPAAIPDDLGRPSGGWRLRLYQVLIDALSASRRKIAGTPLVSISDL